MNNNRLWILLIWLIPAYLIGLFIHQFGVQHSINTIYKNGESLDAQVVDFRIKYIASQTNGYVVVEFQPSGADSPLQKKLSLNVQIAARIMETNPIPIRYLPGVGEAVVMEPTYELQIEMIRSNLAIIAISAVFMGLLSWLVTNKFVLNHTAMKGEEVFEVV